MNLKLLNNTIQDFINSHLKSDITQLLLKSIPFENITTKAVIEQIEAKKRCEKKLPTWFTTKNIYYPNKLNIAQTSSELTAAYKANLVSGNSLIDLTGGFGVDAYFFSKKIENVTHCEIDAKLSKIVAHNYKALGVNNITCLNNNGIDTIKNIDKQIDWIYLDPSRRDADKKKVFLLADCTPNIKTFQNLFLKYAQNVLIKTSPLLDLKATLLELNNIKHVYCVAVNNDVKELLWVLERNFKGKPILKTVNILKEIVQKFEFNFEDESHQVPNYSKPLNYLYEPNAAILNTGAFNSVGTQLNVEKLHKHSHLYTSEYLIDFPGRRFKIEKILPFNKKIVAKEKITCANITTRNFPITVHEIRKKLKIKDGGKTYLFFTTNLDNEKQIIVCLKL